MKLITLLSKMDSIELAQQVANQFKTEFPEVEKDNIFHLPNELFFKHKSVALSKHHRFAKYPKHSHEFVEINYVLSGHVTQIVNQETINLKTHEFVLIPPKLTHEILPLSEKDIMINLMFPLQTFSATDLSYIVNDASLSLDLLLKRQASTAFHLTNNVISQLIEQIAIEYFLPEKFSNEMIHHYVTLLFFNLLRVLHNQLLPDIQEQTLTTILQLIEKNFANITLQDLADSTGYNYNYISNLIKQELGLTFTEIVLNQRILHAADLLRNTKLPIEQIMIKIGLNNKTYFYHKFSNQYATTPSNYRKSFISNNIGLLKANMV